MMMSVNDDKIIEEIVKMIKDAYSPREAREEINSKYPEYDDREKLEKLIPKVLSNFDNKKQKQMKKTEYMMYFLTTMGDVVKKRTDI